MAQSYQSQRDRGLSRKVHFINLKGGKCEACGYSKSIASLCFHHLRDKEFSLDMKRLSNSSLATLLLELAKCQLLCHNCHHELHHPDLELEKFDATKAAIAVANQKVIGSRVLRPECKACGAEVKDYRNKFCSTTCYRQSLAATPTT